MGPQVDKFYYVAWWQIIWVVWNSLLDSYYCHINTSINGGMCQGALPTLQHRVHLLFDLCGDVWCSIVIYQCFCVYMDPISWSSTLVLFSQMYYALSDLCQVYSYEDFSSETPVFGWVWHWYGLCGVCLFLNKWRGEHQDMYEYTQIRGLCCQECIWNGWVVCLSDS